MERRGGVWEKDSNLDPSSSDDTPVDLKYLGGRGGGGRKRERKREREEKGEEEEEE